MIYGLDADPLPEGVTPLEAVVVIKALTEDGEIMIAKRSTSGLTAWEEAGMLLAALDATRAELHGDFDYDLE